MPLKKHCIQINSLVLTGELIWLLYCLIIPWLVLEDIRKKLPVLHNSRSWTRFKEPMRQSLTVLHERSISNLIGEPTAFLVIQPLY
jgi:hypothetical protein